MILFDLEFWLNFDLAELITLPYSIDMRPQWNDKHRSSTSTEEKNIDDDEEEEANSPFAITT